MTHTPRGYLGKPLAYGDNGIVPTSNTRSLYVGNPVALSGIPEIFTVLFRYWGLLIHFLYPIHRYLHNPWQSGSRGPVLIIYTA